MKYKIYALFLFLLLQGCTLYDPYQRPQVCCPSEWRLTIGAEKMVQNTTNWWKLFKDPVLDQLIAMALENNQNLQVAISTVNQFADELQITRSGLYPQVNVSANGGRQKSSLEGLPSLPVGQRINNLYEVLGNVSYLVDLWGQVRSASAASLASLLAQEEVQKSVVLGLISSVASTYIQLRQFDEEFKIAHSTIASRESSYALAQLRFQLGLTSEMPVMQSLAELEFTKARTKEVELSIAQTENLLSILIGVPPQRIERGSTLQQLKMPPSIPEILPSNLINERPDIKAAEWQLISANANIGVAKAAFFPQINLTGNFGQQSLKLSQLLTSPANTWQYGLSLLQEIFTGGSLTGNLRLSQDEKVTALHQYFQTILQAFQEVDNAFIGHRIALDQVSIFSERSKALAMYLELAKLQYAEGEVDYLNVLDAERQLFLAQLDEVQAQGNSFITLVDIYQALGGNWVDSANERVCLQPEM